MRYLIEGEWLAAGSDVAFLEDIDLHVLRKEDPDSDIEFAAVDEEGVFEVLLDDEGVGLQVEGSGGVVVADVVAVEEVLEFLEGVEEVDAVASVHVRWLEHPQVAFGRLEHFLQLRDSITIFLKRSTC